MSFAILGQTAAGEVVVTGAENIDTSFPSFTGDLQRVGGKIKTIEGDSMNA
jgi:5-enolpyruvylshikimate-3-phosphate synthase